MQVITAKEEDVRRRGRRWLGICKWNATVLILACLEFRALFLCFRLNIYTKNEQLSEHTQWHTCTHTHSQPTHIQRPTIYVYVYTNTMCSIGFIINASIRSMFVPHKNLLSGLDFVTPSPASRLLLVVVFVLYSPRAFILPGPLRPGSGLVCSVLLRPVAAIGLLSFIYLFMSGASVAIFYFHFGLRMPGHSHFVCANHRGSKVRPIWPPSLAPLISPARMYRNIQLVLTARCGVYWIVMEIYG